MASRLLTLNCPISCVQTSDWFSSILVPSKWLSSILPWSQIHGLWNKWEPWPVYSVPLPFRVYRRYLPARKHRKEVRQRIVFGFNIGIEGFMVVEVIVRDVWKIPPRNCSPAIRRWSMACELTSIKAYLQPASTISAKSLFRLTASGVVCVESNATSPRGYAP